MFDLHCAQNDIGFCFLTTPLSPAAPFFLSPLVSIKHLLRGVKKKKKSIKWFCGYALFPQDNISALIYNEWICNVLFEALGGQNRTKTVKQKHLDTAALSLIRGQHDSAVHAAFPSLCEIFMLIICTPPTAFHAVICYVWKINPMLTESNAGYLTCFRFWPDASLINWSPPKNVGQLCGVAFVADRNAVLNLYVYLMQIN